MQRVFVLDGDPLCPLPKVESWVKDFDASNLFGGNPRKIQ